MQDTIQSNEELFERPGLKTHLVITGFFGVIGAWSNKVANAIRISVV
jgi:hypothetical protein